MLLLAALTLSGCGDDNDQDNPPTTTNANVNANDLSKCPFANRLEFPRLKAGANNKVIVNSTNSAFDKEGINYCVEWDTTLKAQRWSCYVMHNGYKVNGILRYSGNPQYPFDPQLTADEYWDQDYFKGSGFDHGHICPSGDRLFSAKANKQTFYMTNMQPQYNKFNTGLWEDLEAKVRSWCVASGVTNLYVCKGATIDKPEHIMMRIQDKLIAPKYFFCALMAETASGFKGIAFWMENENISRKGDDLKKYVISINELERKTDIDFFCNITDALEEKAESQSDTSQWGF